MSSDTPNRLWQRPADRKWLIVALLTALAAFLLIYWAAGKWSEGLLMHIMAGAFAVATAAWVLLDIMNDQLHPGCSQAPTPGCRFCKWRLMAQLIGAATGIIWLIL